MIMWLAIYIQNSLLTSGLEVEYYDEIEVRNTIFVAESLIISVPYKVDELLMKGYCDTVHWR